MLKYDYILYLTSMSSNSKE